MMKLLLLVSFLGATLASKELYMKYAEKKIMHSCFGDDVMKDMYMKMKQYYMECKEESGSSKYHTKSKPMKDQQQQLLQQQQQLFMQQQQQQQQQQYQQQPLIDYMSLFQSDGGVPQFVPYYFAQGQGAAPFGLVRQKRAAFTQEKIRKLVKKMSYKMEMAKCILMKFGFLDSNLNLQYDTIKSQYQTMNIDPELKEDLLEISHKCKKMVSCFSEDKPEADDLPIGLKQAMGYIKCTKKMKVKACIKKDLRSKPDMFELEGLDGLFDHMDEDEQMFKVLKLNTKFGKNPYDMFD